MASVADHSARLRVMEKRISELEKKAVSSGRGSTSEGVSGAGPSQGSRGGMLPIRGGQMRGKVGTVRGRFAPYDPKPWKFDGFQQSKMMDDWKKVTLDAISAATTEAIKATNMKRLGVDSYVLDPKEAAAVVTAQTPVVVAKPAVVTAQTPVVVAKPSVVTAKTPAAETPGIVDVDTVESEDEMEMCDGNGKKTKGPGGDH
uniref:Uncharacterized protein n=1 Tax=Panagrolaimus sp. JU765 TaxID=591449 RepID=A0AC34Q1R5_9BILA